MRLNILFTAIFLLGTSAAFCTAAPEPSIVPNNNEWTLNTVFTNPQQITVRIPGKRAPQRFWYIILTMTNTSNIDAPFYPKCDLMTDTFKILPAYKDTKNIVFGRILKRHKKKFPFLESMETADSRILQGRDQTRDMVIIWPDFDPKARSISLFIAGLSNETVSVIHPTIMDSDGNPLKLYLRKTLELKYSIGGDEKLRNRSKLVFKSKRWVMR
ncbi:MAG: hypothetical protein K8R02_07145 [Anaerohalosphaeraceae bacterium]|nr:hypothetical protein [Anaerohalosphaeraceae bacterium]